MVLRTARQGRRRGQQFWGCTGYPDDCTAILSIGDEVDSSLAPSSEAGPACPLCGRDTIRRVARRGRHRGQPFWSCTDRTCRGLINIPEPTDDHSPDVPTQAMPRRVPWSDATTSRAGWVVRYAVAGASLRGVQSRPPEWTGLRHLWLARTDASTSPEPGVSRLAALLRRVIQRGTAPPLHPDAERIVLEAAGLSDAIEPARLRGDLSLRLRRNAVATARDGVGYALAAPPLEVDATLALDSHEEQLFLTEWLPRVSTDAARWATPQAPLESLVGGAGVSTTGAQRVDFLLSGDQGSAFVVEIDGEQHADQVTIDSERDELLDQAGYEVLRVPAAEVRSGSGVHLDRVATRLAGLSGAERSREGAQSTLGSGPIEVHHAVLALAEALASGLLRGDHWTIQLEGGSPWLPEAIVPYLNLLLGFDRIWALSAAPDTVSLRDGKRSLGVRRTEDGYVRSPREVVASSTITLLLDGQRGPCESLPAQNGTPCIVVRRAALPVEIDEGRAEAAAGVQEIAADPNGLAWGLTQVLRGVFAKEDFREGQLEALIEVLSKRDCAVLLPTGAGKSLIYQLAGLCLPGRTLVIDPLVSLMEDQVAGLAEHGVDRGVALSSYTTMQGQADDLLRDIASGDALFVFVSPERLQSQKFRDAIRTLAYTPTPITLAVVDEAHCVSEWGHDFRTAYLNIGSVLREVCRDTTGKAPALIALTGTASRAVLKDVLFELDIEQTSERSVVRPRSFDRPELNYQIVRAKPQEARAALAGVFQSLPARFQTPAAQFFSPQGERTHSGLIFCPHVNGDYGVVKIAEVVGTSIGGAVQIYAGSAPRDFDPTDWEDVKRRSATLFKKNQAPLLVSTKAFGMGIDKPNIRYVVHFGIPSSIEGYYQEVGRAGRDRNAAHCVLMLIEYDEERNRLMLAEDAHLEEARSAADAVGWAEADDVTRQLFFHFNSFGGVDREVADVQRLLDQIDEWGRMRELRLPFWQQESDRERQRPEERQERAIHRLVVLGVVGDYLVEWGSRAFSLSLANIDSSGIAGRYVEYVRRSQPARVESARLDAGRYAEAPLSPATIGCARLLISFVYQFTEGSRRRSLREMWLAAKDSIANADDELRERVLRYLTEGDISPVLERLAESPEFSYTPWLDELSQFTVPDEVRELRGNAARLLASYPDHPGLLLARSLAELLDPEGDLQEIALNIESSLISARDHYRVPPSALEVVAEWLTERCAGQREGPLTAVAIALTAGAAGEEVVTGLHHGALSSDTAEPGLRALAFTGVLERAVLELNDVARELEGIPT